MADQGESSSSSQTCCDELPAAAAESGNRDGAESGDEEHRAPPFLRIPPELIIDILERAGGRAFFLADLSRLTVCKAWYGCAWTVLHSHLHLNVRRLPQFDAFLQIDGVYEGMRSLRSVVIDFSQPICPEDAQLVNSRGHVSRPSIDGHEYIFFGLAATLADITQLLRGSGCLTSLRLVWKSAAGLFRSDTGNTRIYTRLWSDTLRSLKNLTSLEIELDLPELANPDEVPGQAHFCAAISSLLPQLQRLQFTLNPMCLALMDLPPKKELPELRLEELLMLMTSNDKPPHHCLDEIPHPTCVPDKTTAPDPGLLRNVDDIEARMKKVGERMNTGRRFVRKITDVSTAKVMTARDVMTGKRYTLHRKDGLDRYYTSS